MAGPAAKTLVPEAAGPRGRSRQPRDLRALWQRAARWTVEATGTPWAFLVAVLVIVLWATTGPLFRFSDTWQLVINTGTTIVTFLMVFLIQQSQNRDTKALHAKLNELIAAVEGASNRLIDVEDLSEEDLTRLHEQYRQLARRTKEGGDDGGKTTVSDVAPPVDRTLAALRPQAAEETPPPPDAPPPPKRRKGGRPSG